MWIEVSSSVPYFLEVGLILSPIIRGDDKFLDRPTSLVFCFIVRIFRLMLVLLYIYIYIYIYISSTNIPPIMIINSIYETQNLLSL